MLVEFCPPPDVFTDGVLVLDASTSMLETTADTRRKIDVAEDAARIFLDGLRLLPGQDRAAIVTFNDTAQTLQGLTHDSSLMQYALTRIRIGQYTRVDLGIERATVELVTRGRPGHVQAMVVLSDGMANPVSADTVIEAAQRARLAGITVYVVGMGPSMDERVLRAMASGPARFFPAPDPTMIRSIYADLTKRVPCPSERYWGRR